MSAAQPTFGHASLRQPRISRAILFSIEDRDSAHLAKVNTCVPRSEDFAQNRLCYIVFATPPEGEHCTSQPDRTFMGRPLALAGGPMTSELEGWSHDSLGKLLLRRNRAGSHRVAGGHGVLSLPFLSFVV